MESMKLDIEDNNLKPEQIPHKGEKLQPETRKDIMEALLNPEEAFLGAGNYGIVLNNIKFKGNWVCMKLIWHKIDIIEGSEYSDIDDDYVKALKKYKSYFDEIKRKRKEFLDKVNGEFVSQNSPSEEFQKQFKAFEILKEFGIDCCVPQPLIFGLEDLGDTFLMEEDDEETQKYNVYTQNTFSVLVMEKIEGKNLQEILDSPNENRVLIDLFKKDTNNFIENLRKAISTLNEQGLFHGDINLRNIMIDGKGKPVIIDFGVNTVIVERDDKEDLENTIRSFKNRLNI